MEDLISIVVPVYNVENYVKECLDSILGQSYSNLQIIIVNDGSTDQSGNICEEYAKKDSRVEYVYQKNKGLSAARNKGISCAKGEFICFVDSDDYVHKKYVECLYYGMINNNADMSMCGYIRDGFFVEKKDNNIKCNIYDGKEMMRNFYSFDVLFMNVAWNKLYRKKAFLNERFPEGMLYEDFALNARIMYSCNRIAICDQELYFYRRNRQGITLSSFSEKQLDALKQIENRMLFFRQVNEEGIYNRFLQEYEVVNLKYYFLCRKNDTPNKLLICSELRKKYKYYFINTVKAKENKLMRKIYITLGYFFPYFMGLITNIIIKD